MMGGGVGFDRRGVAEACVNAKRLERMHCGLW